jgi:ubiquinone/menaquinone biosynthesis C-methylase UbiE
MIVLDVGCGPAPFYDRPRGCTLIGLDASFASVRANHALDVPVFGSALRMPLPDASVDLTICAYALHHMVGGTREASARRMVAAVREMARVTKPRGRLVVMEMCPNPVARAFEVLAWNGAKTVLGGLLDMFFWDVRTLTRTVEAAAPGARVSVSRVEVPPWLMIPPVFALPWLRVPRALYPLDACVLECSL